MAVAPTATARLAAANSRRANSSRSKLMKTRRRNSTGANRGNGEKISVFSVLSCSISSLYLSVHVRQYQSETHSHHGLKLQRRPIIIGMIHGLAGSAALMLLVVPTISSPVLAMTYILVFGVGSIGGMMVMSLLIGLPFHFTASRFDILNKGIRLCSGVFSMGLGAMIIYEKLVQSRG